MGGGPFAAGLEHDPFPAIREKYRELLALRSIFGNCVSKSASIPSISSKFPAGAEQGIFSAEQGIKVPCSRESRDISRQKRRLGRALSRWGTALLGVLSA
jgi:hypothetical protein